MDPRLNKEITIPTAIVAAGMFDTTDPSLANFHREPSSSLLPAENVGFLAGSRDIECKYVFEGDGFNGPHMNCRMRVISTDDPTGPFWEESQMQFVPKPSWWISKADASEEQLAGLCPCSRTSGATTRFLRGED